MKHYILLIPFLSFLTTAQPPTPSATQLMSGAGQGRTGDVADDVIENGFDVSDGQSDLHQEDIETLEENEDSIAHLNEKVVGNDLAISANSAVGDLVRAPSYECSSPSPGTMVPESAYLISHNWPHHYDNTGSSWCYWYLVPLPGKSVHLDWTYFKVILYHM